MPLPKRKTTKARQGDRRSHLHLEARELIECPQCHQPKLPHIACPSCGCYDGRAVLDVETKVKKQAEKTARAEKAAKGESAPEVKAAKPEKVKKEKPAKAEKAEKPVKEKKPKAEKAAVETPEKPARVKKEKKKEA